MSSGLNSMDSFLEIRPSLMIIRTLTSFFSCIVTW